MADQTNEMQNYAVGDSEDYTPSAAVTAGTPTLVGGHAGLPNIDIAASAKGSLQVRGLAKVVQAAEILAVGADVWWDADGDPVQRVARYVVKCHDHSHDISVSALIADGVVDNNKQG